MWSAAKVMATCGTKQSSYFASLFKGKEWRKNRINCTKRKYSNPITHNRTPLIRKIEQLAKENEFGNIASRTPKLSSSSSFRRVMIREQKSEMSAKSSSSTKQQEVHDGHHVILAFLLWDSVLIPPSVVSKTGIRAAPDIHCMFWPRHWVPSSQVSNQIGQYKNKKRYDLVLIVAQRQRWPCLVGLVQIWWVIVSLWGWEWIPNCRSDGDDTISPTRILNSWQRPPFTSNTAWQSESLFR